MAANKRQQSNHDAAPDQDHFVRCPAVFLSSLSQEEYEDMKQLYQVAYERALTKASQPKPFVPPFEFEFSDGI